MNKPLWYLIYTRVKKERIISQELSKQGIDFCLPMQRVISVWHDRKKIIEKPLFPSYIFVSPSDKQDFFKILEISGVIDYVRFGKELAVVPQRDIDNLKIIAASKANVDVLPSLYLPGQKLIVISGPFSGLQCELIKYDKSVKALVRIDILKRDLLLNVPSDCLTPVSFQA